MFEAKIRQNFVLYLMLHIGRYAFPLILTPFLAHYLGKDGFGQFVVISSCVWSSVIFMDFGFYVYGVNRIASADSNRQVADEASAIISAKLALVPACVLAYTMLSMISGQFARDPGASMLGALLAVSLGGGFAWYFQGRQRGGTAVMIEGLPQLLQLILILSLVRSPADLRIVVLIQAIAPLTSILVSVWIIRREQILLRIDPDAIIPTLRSAKPYFFERLCFSLYTALVPTLVSVLAGVDSAAIYSLGDRVNIFLGSLAAPVAQTMIPVLTRVAKEDSASWRISVLVTAATVLFCGVMAIAVYFSIGIAIRLFFSQAYEAGIPTARVFCVAAFISSITIGLSNFVIVPRNAGSILTWSALSALCFSMATLVLLTPRYGAVGAAFSRVVAETATATILLCKAVSLYRRSKQVQTAFS